MRTLGAGELTVGAARSLLVSLAAVVSGEVKTRSFTHNSRFFDHLTFRHLEKDKVLLGFIFPVTAGEGEESVYTSFGPEEYSALLRLVRQRNSAVYQRLLQLRVNEDPASQTQPVSRSSSLFSDDGTASGDDANPNTDPSDTVREAGVARFGNGS